MDLKGAVQKHMQQAIMDAPVPTDLKRAALKHHKFAQFSDAIYKQLLGVERIRREKKKPPLKPNTVKDTIYAFVHTYLTGVETEAVRRAESDLSRIAREQAEQKAKDLEASSSGTLVGEYQELNEHGTFTDERDVGVKANG